MREVTAEEIAWSRGPRVWDLGNRVLYDLCTSHPRHQRADEVVAKVWLIGRSYPAAIECRRRGHGEDLIGDDFYQVTVAPAVVQSGIDAWIADASRTADPGSHAALAAHFRLTALFESMTGQEKRSLASKYLHFHSPDVFLIYDSRARRAITKVAPPANPPREVRRSDHDEEYRNFTWRCIWLRERIRTSFGVFLTPREIDKLLSRIADDERRARRPATFG